MLEPREADLPFLFLFLVVLPLVTYVLLGKWSETSKKGERINLLAQLAAEEALRAQTMAVADAIHLVSTPKNGIHVCARCYSPATARCSRCKSIRYCSGTCQIIHWRQVHKQECQQLDSASSCSSPRASFSENSNSLFFGYNAQQSLMDNEPAENTIDHPIGSGASISDNFSAVDTSQEAMPPRRTTDRKPSCKSGREMSRRRDAAVFDSCDEASCSKATNLSSSNNISIVHSKGQGEASNMYVNDQTMKCSRQHEMEPNLRTKTGSSSSLHQRKNGTNAFETGGDFTLDEENLSHVENMYTDVAVESKCLFETTAMKVSGKAKTVPHPPGTKISASSKLHEVFGEQSATQIDEGGHTAEDPKLARMRDAYTASASNGITNIGFKKMMSLRKSIKLSRQEASEFSTVHKKMRMLFPYEEFIRIFNSPGVNLLPRGLLNCGNSCYANVVLQCLTSTKPLTIFLLHKSHSKSCCGKDWCLMCELEQHVMMLQECGGPLSPSRILLHMRNINRQIGDGSQEDAHEFLRLLVASMQSICLEGQGGENNVDPRLQETTFIQHTFGGRLRSKVKCLRCHHESERYESIMDLTLEIFGWVESLEDALTQFTTPEELDGENMYRCGRCASYVPARKQLSIHEAPNILTIVLKRFQEGKYGKINKCITFPDMLDMIPFMTGCGDIPPLYVLYAVVVHLDSFNASFSGHYVAYVKDLQGGWLRVDDTEVHPVPMSQVMSEGAYMLFYMRSCPRPQSSTLEKVFLQHVPAMSRRCPSETQKPSKQTQSNSNSHFVEPHPSFDLEPENGTGLTDHAHGNLRRIVNRNMAHLREFSDATSSDWSLFTSSDESSFTTESTRDSFSTVDYADTCNGDTFSSIFNNLYAPESSINTLCCRKFSSSRPQTRFVSGERGYILHSYLSTQPQMKGDDLRKVSDSSTDLPANNYFKKSVKYGSNPRNDVDQTSHHCIL